MEITADIVFNKLRRLRTKGYRWAPASVQDSVFSHSGLLSNPNAIQTATLTANGLVAKFPAWRICAESPPPDIPLTSWHGNRSADAGNINLRHPDGRWFWSRNLVKKQLGDPLSSEVLGDPEVPVRDILADHGKAFYLILEDEHRLDGSRRGSPASGIIASLERSADGTQ